MISNDELLSLIGRITEKGATVTTTLDDEALTEGREIVATVTVSGVRGIGPLPMGAISAAEKISDALAAISNFEDRIEAKQERLEDRADRLRDEGNARLKKGRDAMALIPFGQPILVGHYSEKTDRNYRNRAWNNMGKGFEALKQADKVASRAASVGSGGISSDDPLAVAQLKEKLAKLEAFQAKAVAVNKLARKKDTTGLAALGYNAAQIGELLTPQWGPGRGPVGIPPYELSNNNANIRTVKQRIEALEKNATRETVETETDSGVKLVENVEANRVQLFFPGKPATEVRDLLKTEGFRWAPSEGAWQKQLNARAVWSAQRVLEAFAKHQTVS